jgi:hypothetical protein
MIKPTRIYKHSSAGTDWAALLLVGGLGLTLALQLTTVRKSDFTSVYASLASFSRLPANEIINVNLCPCNWAIISL